ncbi:MAG: tyrosine-type recombinase/integrase [Terriglobia bacterium]
MSVYRRGSVYWYHFEFEGRHIQQSSGFSNKTAALRAEARRKADLLERRAGVTPRQAPPKLEVYIKEFLKWSQQQRRKHTFELHDRNCQTLLRFFRGKWLDQITPNMVEEFKAARLREERRNSHDGSTLSPATVNRALTTLKLIFNHAARSGLLISNPTLGVRFLQEGGGRMRVITWEEERAYLSQASQPLRDIAQIILETGMRPEEVFRLEAANLTFERRTIFNPFGKTKAAKRTIPMTDTVFDILRRRANGASRKLVFQSPRHPEQPIGSVRKAHDAAVMRASIADHFRLYDLRHTYGTRAAEAGVDLATLAALMGHTKIQMTMRYLHPADQHKQEAARKLEALKASRSTKGDTPSTSSKESPPTVVPRRSRARRVNPFRPVKSRV